MTEGLTGRGRGDLRADGARLRLQLGGFRLAIDLLEERSVFLEAQGDLRMVGAERLALQGEGPLIERLGLREAALRSIERRDVDDGGRHLRMLRAEHLLAD